MKDLIDDTKVPSRGYYYLLDWNQQNNYLFMETKFNKRRLCDLEIHEYKELFNHATNEEFK